MSSIDSTQFQERGQKDRQKLMACIAIMAIVSVILLAISYRGIPYIVLGPIMLLINVAGGIVAMRIAKKHGMDGFEEGMHLVMEGVPLNCTITDEKGAVLFCNDRATKLFNATKEQYFEQLFKDFLPEIQPDGTRSMEKAGRHIQAAFKNGTESFEWWHQTGPGG